MKPPTHRVTFKAYSGVHLRDGHVMRIEADDISIGAIQLVTYRSEYNAGLPTLFVTDVWVTIPPDTEDPVAAATKAAEPVAHDYHLLGVLFNAAVHEPHVTGVYEMNPGGIFSQQSLPELRTHGDVRTRQARAETLGKVFAPIPKSLPDRLQLAIMHFDYAMCALHPFRTLEAGLRMYPVIENLTVHIKQRLQQETGLGEEEHAKSLGIDTSKDDWTYQYRGKIRREQIFSEDASVFRVLREVRNDFEHASADMISLRERVSPILLSANRQVRRAILAELPLTEEGRAIVLRSVFDKPLGNWATQVVTGGNLEGPDDFFTTDAPRFEMYSSISSAHFNESDFDPDAGLLKGDLSYTIDGKVGVIPDGVRAMTNSTLLVAPAELSDEADALPKLRPTMTKVVLNGVDISDQVEQLPDEAS